jgi:hypothetical protein
MVVKMVLREEPAVSDDRTLRERVAEMELKVQEMERRVGSFHIDSDLSLSEDELAQISDIRALARRQIEEIVEASGTQQ